MKATTRVLDGSAIGLSALCLIHCLLLPVAAALLPVLGAWADAEWVHRLFVLIAAPLSWLALLRNATPGRSRVGLVMLAASGLLLLLVGAFVAQAKTQETVATVAGSFCLATAHAWNWRRRRTSHAHPIDPQSPLGGGRS